MNCMVLRYGRHTCHLTTFRFRQNLQHHHLSIEAKVTKHHLWFSTKTWNINLAILIVQRRSSTILVGFVIVHSCQLLFCSSVLFEFVWTLKCLMMMSATVVLPGSVQGTCLPLVYPVIATMLLPLCRKILCGCDGTAKSLLSGCLCLNTITKSLQCCRSDKAATILLECDSSVPPKKLVCFRHWHNTSVV